MARLRYNGLIAALGAELGAADTTITFDAALTSSAGAVPTLATGEYIPLAILDVDGGVLEVVHLTAYTAAATTGTVERAKEGTTAAVHPSGLSVVHGPTAADVNRRAINTQTGTAYTLRLSDAGNFVTMSNASASTLTVPPNSSVAFPVGSVVEGAQLGAGQVTLTPGSGVTISGAPGLKVAEQFGSFALVKTGTDTWLAVGRLAA